MFYHRQNADQKLREYLFTVQAKSKLVSRVTYSLSKAAERAGVLQQKQTVPGRTVGRNQLLQLKFKIPFSQVTPLPQLKLHPLQTLPFSWAEQLYMKPLPGAGTILGENKPSPGATLLGLTQPGSLLNQRDPRVPKHTHHHPTLLAEHLPLLFPPPTMFNFPVSSLPDGPIRPMPSPP